jgi:hypothetical protein
LKPTRFSRNPPPWRRSAALLDPLDPLDPPDLPDLLDLLDLLDLIDLPDPLDCST